MPPHNTALTNLTCTPGPVVVDYTTPTIRCRIRVDLSPRGRHAQALADYHRCRARRGETDFETAEIVVQMPEVSSQRAAIGATMRELHALGRLDGFRRRRLHRQT